MSLKYSDRRPLLRTKEPVKQRSSIFKILIALILMGIVALNVVSVLPSIRSNPEPQPAQELPAQDSDSTLTVKAEADAQVEERHPTANAGTSSDLEVIQANGRSAESYLRFTVSGIAGVVQSARLQVYSTTDTAENGPALYAVENSWKEKEINWDNRPARIGDEVANQDFIRRYSWMEYDVTDLITGDGTYSFVLAGDSNEGVRFSSRESSNGPQLVITYASATPTSAASATSTPAEGEALTFTTEADTYVTQASAAKNFGTSAELQASGASGAAQIPYLRFSVTGISGSNYRVTLRLFATSGHADGLVVRFAENDWTESGTEGMIWKSQPTLLSGPVGNPSTVEEGAWVEYDVSAVVTQDGTYTFALIADDDDSVIFSSREGTAAPELVAMPGPVLPTPTPRPPIPVSSDEVILVGAGDIATCNRDEDEQTAALLDTIPGTVFTVGDNAYPNGSYSEYLNCYDSTWGRHKSRTKPVPGNHEYNTTGAAGYFQYFKNIPAYYAYDLGTWRIYALNSEIDSSSSSPQAAWLLSDLAQNPSQCVLAYWHTPRWSSGTENGSDPSTQMLWEILYNAGAELVINGHEHNYERFAEMDNEGREISPGLRAIVVGTGGAGFYPFGPALETSQVRNDATFGVLKLTLHDENYDWEFIPIADSTFTDRGSSRCH